MTRHEFRKIVKHQWPHAKIKIRTVSFQDLARCSKLCLSVENENKGELTGINELAKSAGILPDTNLRFYS